MTDDEDAERFSLTLSDPWLLPSHKILTNSDLNGHCTSSSLTYISITHVRGFSAPINHSASSRRPGAKKKEKKRKVKRGAEIEIQLRHACLTNHQCEAIRY